ncbi:MAG: type II toxin-antitoxin system RelE/ParE family toxin [Planctomycetota bacterium]|nr:type II toxin-antitoxin system RelE/ParE family toxin [Planctomycetota bacterium]
MIASFNDQALEALYYRGPGPASRTIPADLHRVLRRKLDQLNSAVDLADLRVPPANRLEALRGDRQGYHSIRVNDQWRIVFQWRAGAAHEVAMVDYH